jgi:hypothetical protein
MVQTKDKVKGIEIVNLALQKIEEVIKAKGGYFLKKYDPKVIGDYEDNQNVAEAQELDVSEDEDEEGMDVDISGTICCATL